MREVGLAADTTALNVLPGMPRQAGLSSCEAESDACTEGSVVEVSR